MIRTSHLRKEYDGHAALENLSFEIPRGAVFGLIGPNGAGKTTLLRILATLEPPTCGTVLVGGFDAEREPAEIRRRLGFMPDFQHFHEEMKVTEYLDYFARAYKMEPAVSEKRMRHILDFTQLSVKAAERVGTLSRGMKQRLSLARAILHDPELLLLDEPTSGLDPKARLDFRAIVGQLAAEGKTLVISSHILEDLATVCNWVGILEKGRLLECGRIRNILESMASVTRLRVRCVAGLERAAALLKDSPQVASVVVDGDWLEVSFRGELAAQAELLSTLTAAGVKVALFEEQRAGLQDIFLRGSSHEVA
jgi:ABC-2 type transport system ATP-binding protein